MITVQAQQVLKGAAALTGQPWLSQSGAGIQQDTLRMLLPVMNQGLTHIWRMGDWPEICPPPVQRRAVPTMWSAGLAYAQGAIVGDLTSNGVYLAIQAVPSSTDRPSKAPPGYWVQLLRAYGASEYDTSMTYTAGSLCFDAASFATYAPTTGVGPGVPPTSNGTVNSPWVVIPTWDGTFTFTNGWDAGTLGDVYRADQKCPTVAYPSLTLADGDWDLQPNVNGYLLSEDVAQAWLSYRLPVPQLTGDLYDSTVTYPAGAQVYFQDGTGLYGDFYTAVATATAGKSPATNASLWAVVQIPQRFSNYLQYWVAMTWQHGQGQSDKASLVQSRFMEPELIQLKKQLERIKSAAGQMNVKTRIEGRR